MPELEIIMYGKTMLYKSDINKFKFLNKTILGLKNSPVQNSCKIKIKILKFDLVGDKNMEPTESGRRSRFFGNMRPVDNPIRKWPENSEI